MMPALSALSMKIDRFEYRRGFPPVQVRVSPATADALSTEIFCGVYFTERAFGSWLEVRFAIEHGLKYRGVPLFVTGSRYGLRDLYPTSWLHARNQ